MIRQIFKKFFKEIHGGLVEYLILIAIAGVVATTTFPSIRTDMANWFTGMTNNVTQGISGTTGGANTTTSSDGTGDTTNTTDTSSTTSTTLTASVITEDFSDGTYNFPISGSWNSGSGVFAGKGYYDYTYPDDNCYGCSEDPDGQTGGNTNSTITLNVPSGETGMVDFDYWVSSETNDYLNISLDGTQIAHTSGIDYLNHYHYNQGGLTAGTHTLTLSYIKNNSGDMGTDAGYFDNLSLSLNPGTTNGNPTGTTTLVSTGVNSITEDFEDNLYVFAMTGNGSLAGPDKYYDSWYGYNKPSGYLQLAGYYSYIPCPDCDDDPIGGTTQETITINVPSGKTGTLSFDYWVSSELNCDIYTITVDGTQVVRISGQTTSTHYQKTGLSPGSHTLVASYSKDSYGDVGTDSGYLDNVTLSVN